MKNYALVTAAGIGKRFGGEVAKQYLTIKEKPLLYYCLLPFVQHSQIASIILVVSEAAKEAVERLLPDWQFEKEIKIVIGGKERQDSVANGLAAIGKGVDNVLVHDGSRPCLTAALIDRLLTSLAENKAVVPALPVRETIKRADSQRQIIGTEKREGLWLVQTPQAFSLPLLKEAMKKAAAENFYGSDEAMLIERLGEKVAIVEGDVWNVKVTYAPDLEIVESWLILQENSQ